MTWNHQICDECYVSQRRRRGLPPKEPIRVVGGDRMFDACCWCGRWNNSQIYMRADPALMPCNHWQEVLG